MEPKIQVLAVDDEPGVLKLVQVGLTVSGYDVTTTTSGEEALRLVETGKPDVVLLDILMVPMSGFVVLDKIRTFSAVPVIVFTAHSLIADKALKLGANGFIAKPFRIEELVKKIESTLDSHKPQG